MVIHSSATLHWQQQTSSFASDLWVPFGRALAGDWGIASAGILETGKPMSTSCSSMALSVYSSPGKPSWRTFLSCWPFRTWQSSCLDFVFSGSGPLVLKVEFVGLITSWDRQGTRPLLPQANTLSCSDRKQIQRKKNLRKEKKENKEQQQ